MAKKLFICVPAFGQMWTTTTVLTTHALNAHLASKGISAGITSLSFPDIAELREMFMTIWYDTMPDVEYLLFIDADMGFPPEMVTDMIMFDEPIVGTVYPQRKAPLSWAGSGTGQTVTERRGNFMLVEGVGMGCTLIRRDAVTKMIEAYPQLIDERIKLHPAGDTLNQAGAKRLLRFFEKYDMPDRGVISEDLSFCLRWNQIGGKVWAAIGYRISHVGPFDYHGRYLDVVENAEALAAGAAPPPPLAQTMGGSTTAEPVTIVPPPSAPTPAPVMQAAEANGANGSHKVDGRTKAGRAAKKAAAIAAKDQGGASQEAAE